MNGITGLLLLAALIFLGMPTVARAGINELVSNLDGLDKIRVETPELAATQLARNVVAAGGGRLVSATYVMTGTAGQALVATTTGTTRALGSGFWNGGVPAPTDVGDVPGDGDDPGEVVEGLPAVFRLHQNQPNPFTRGTAIRYDLPRPGWVRIRIHDVAGKLVRTLADGVESAGRKQILWDGRDGNGAAVAAGIFLYVVETPENRASGKLVRMQ